MSFKYPGYRLTISAMTSPRLSNHDLTGGMHDPGAPAAEKLANLTYTTLVVDKQAPAFDPVWRRRDVVLSVILALTVGLVWLYFTG